MEKKKRHCCQHFCIKDSTAVYGQDSLSDKLTPTQQALEINAIFESSMKSENFKPV